MLNLRVKYFLSPEGMLCFPIWYQELYKEVSQQAGFIKVRYEAEENIFTIYLSFANQKTLDHWASTAEHDQLVAQIEAYFIKPKEVEHHYRCLSRLQNLQNISET